MASAAVNIATSRIRCRPSSAACAKRFIRGLSPHRQSLERTPGSRNTRFPPRMPSFWRDATPPGKRSRHRCCCVTDPATTTACTRICTANMCFRCRSPILLSEPGADFSGGEFVLTEQRPRRQTRVEVCPLRQGDAVMFAVHHRPAQGARGVYRVNMRHGVSRAPQRCAGTRWASSFMTRPDAIVSVPSTARNCSGMHTAQGLKPADPAAASSRKNTRCCHVSAARDGPQRGAAIEAAIDFRLAMPAERPGNGARKRRAVGADQSARTRLVSPGSRAWVRRTC